MANQFGGPSASAAFFTNLLGSTMGTFKEDYDKRQKDEKERKELDFEIVMKAINDPNWIATHTPSQRQFAMERAIDILKPKGHTGIKDKLRDLFGGGGPQASMQAGSILSQTDKRPKANVQMPTQTAALGGTGPEQVRSRTVTLPPPPQSAPEVTFGEQELRDKERIIGAQEEKALAIEHTKELFKNQQREKQNAEVRARTKDMLGMKTDAEADLAVKRQLIKLGIFEDTPENRALAAESLRQERAQKIEQGGLKAEEMRTRIKKINSDITNAQERIRQADERIKISAHKSQNDPQVKGAWLKVNQYKAEAQRLAVMAAIAYSKGDTDSAALYEADSKAAETEMQKLIDSIEARQNEHSGGVKLPSPPTGRASTVKRSDVEKRAQQEGIPVQDLINALPKGTKVIP